MEILKTPIKSENDKKEYRLIRLENGLKALLISNINEKSLSAASLTVFVGSYDNPHHVPGLAHFFEHMIFLDLGNYEKSFKDFVQDHSGYSNASTGNDFTNYEFEVNNEKFTEAMIRFSQLFISPKLDKSFMQTERINVDSEFRLNKPDTLSRRAHIHRLYLNQEHHASIFPIGNLKTLKDNISDDDLHAELIKFFENYVANKMVLCVQSNQSLDEMQQIVVDNFSVIKKNDAIKFNYEYPVDFETLVRPEFYSKVLYIKDPNENNLTISWLLPSEKRHYKTKPLYVLTRIFENNDEGGIVPYLKDKNLIRGLSFNTASWLTSAQFSRLRLHVELTNEGYEKIDQVLGAIYSYLLMIQEAPRDDLKRLYNDAQEYEMLNFKFREEKSALENVTDEKDMLYFYEDEDILRGPHLLMEYNEDILMDYINRLNEGKFNITFLTKNHENFNLHEDMYEIDYEEVDMPDNFKDLWTERKLIPEFFLEQPNPYKVTNLEIFTDDEKLDHPEKIFKNEIIEIWHLLDRKFGKPTVNIKIILQLKNYSRDAETYARMYLLKTMSTEIFYKIFAKSRKAGFINTMTADVDHISFKINGYSEKILMIIENTFIEFKSIIENVQESFFNKKLEELKKSLKDNVQTQYSVGYNELIKVITNKWYTSFDLLDALDRVKFENFKSLIEESLQQIKATTLVQGNMKKEDALKIAELFQKYFNCEGLDEENCVVSRGYQIPKGSNTIRLKSLHPTDDVSFIRNYYQIGPYTIRTQNLAAMLYLFFKPKAFDFLRTKEQLSYSTSFEIQKDVNMLGFTVTVSSSESVNDYIKVSSKIDEFINVLCHKYINEMTNEEFENVKNGRIDILSQPNLSLADEFKKNLREIQEEAYNFNRTIEAIEDAKIITKEELESFFESVFGTQNIRKLMVQVIGKKQSNDEQNTTRQLLSDKTEIDENMIIDIHDFQKNLFLYPVNFN